MDLLVRREPFGYLAIDRDTESLHVLRTAHDVDFSDPSALQVANATGVYEQPASIEIRPTTVERDDILAAPTIVEFYPTRVCNERCPNFCYFGDILNTRGPNFPTEHIRPFIDNLWHAGVFQLVVLGGEPFLYPHLPVLLEEAGRRQFVVSLSTNGTRWRPDVIERIIEFKIHLNVSLHSHEPSVQDALVGRDGAFQRTIGTMRLLVQAGIPPHVSIVLTRANHLNIADTVSFLHDLGIASVSVLHTQNTGFARHHHHDLLDFENYVTAAAEATRQADLYDMALQATTNYPFLVVKGMQYTLGCGLENMLYGHPDGRRVVYVLDDGSILGTLYQNLLKPRRLGDCVTGDLGAIWRTSEELDHIRHSRAHQACLKCEHFTYCRGGPPQGEFAPARVDVPRCPRFRPELSAE